MPFSSFIKGKLALWQFRAIATQTTSTGNSQLNITPGVGNFFILDTLRYGADDYASGRTIAIFTEDEDGNSHLVWDEASVDNARKFIPSQNVTDSNTQVDSKQRCRRSDKS